jgi:hypothetical protein
MIPSTRHNISTGDSWFDVSFAGFSARSASCSLFMLQIKTYSSKACSRATCVVQVTIVSRDSLGVSGA